MLEGGKKHFLGRLEPDADALKTLRNIQLGGLIIKGCSLLSTICHLQEIIWYIYMGSTCGPMSSQRQKLSQIAVKCFHISLFKRFTFNQFREMDPFHIQRGASEYEMPKR